MRRESDIDWDREVEAVIRARGARLSWRAIGASLGLSGKSVQQAMKRRGLILAKPNVAKSRSEVLEEMQNRNAKRALGRANEDQKASRKVVAIHGYVSFRTLARLDRDIQAGIDPVEAGRAIFGNRIPRPLLGVQG